MASRRSSAVLSGHGHGHSAAAMHPHASYPHLPTTSPLPIAVSSPHIALSHSHQGSPSLHSRPVRPIKRSSLSSSRSTSRPHPSSPLQPHPHTQSSFSSSHSHPTIPSISLPPPHPSPSPSPSPQTAPHAASYIANLQQQIYFLELELNLLKQSPSTLSSSSDPDAPLDSLVSSLREKYIVQSAKHGKDVDDLRAANTHLTEQLRLLMLEKERITLDLSSTSAKLADTKQRERDKRADAMLLDRRLRDAEAAYQSKLDAASAATKALEEQLRTLCVAQQAAAVEHTHALAEREEREKALHSRVSALTESLHALQVKELELEHQAKALPYHSLREEIDRLKTADRERERLVKDLSMRVEERDERIRLVERQREAVLEENAALLHRVHVWEEELRERDVSDGLHQQGKVRWSEELVKGQHEHGLMKEEAAVLADRVARLKAQLKAEREEKLTAQHTLREWEASIASQQQQHSALTAQHSAAQHSHAQLLVTCQLLKDDADALTTQCDGLTARLSAAEAERDGMRVRLERLEKEAEVVSAVAGLNVEELRGAMGGWERMAEVMNAVVGKMDRREGEKEKEGMGVWRVEEKNAGELHSARSGVSDIYATAGKARREEKEEEEEEGEGSSEEEREREEEEDGEEESEGESIDSSRPSTASSAARPGSARSLSSDVSSSSYSTTSSRASDAVQRGKDKRRIQQRSTAKEQPLSRADRKTDASTGSRGSRRPASAVVGRRR